MDNKDLRCLRCDTKMLFAKREDIQLGKQSFWHDWNHLLHGSLDVDIYVCPKCGKMEFFAPEVYITRWAESDQKTGRSTAASDWKASPGTSVAMKCAECGRLVPQGETYCPVCGEEGLLIPQIKCPACGSVHDFDDPVCPYCKKHFGQNAD